MGEVHDETKATTRGLVLMVPQGIRELPLHDPKRRALRHLGIGATALLATFLFGTAGYLLAGWNLLDSIYMVVITIGTVGYREVHDVETPLLRVHTMILVVCGVVASYYTVAGLVRLVAEEEILDLLGIERVRRKIDELHGHTIVAGVGRMGTLVCEELAEAGLPFVIIESDTTRAPTITERGWLVIWGDATEESVLREAGIQRARSLVTVVPSDAANVFITLTARELAPGVEVIARAEHPTSQKKLRQAGARHVVLPAAIGAHRIASLLTNPGALEFAELVTHSTSLALDLAEFEVRGGGPLERRTLREADIGRRTGVMAIAVKRHNGSLEFPPSPDTRLEGGDTLVVIGRRNQVDLFRTLFITGEEAARESEGKK
jgi:voltage-gated potassium channel